MDVFRCLGTLGIKLNENARSETSLRLSRDWRFWGRRKYCTDVFLNGACAHPDSYASTKRQLSRSDPLQGKKERKKEEREVERWGSKH